MGPRLAWFGVCLSLAAGCKKPEVGDCQVRCEAADLCPEGLACVDGMCRTEGLGGACDAPADAADPSDAAIDSVAPHVGRPSPLVQPHTRAAALNDNLRIVGDGRRLYFCEGGVAYVGERPALDQRFGPPKAVDGEDLEAFQVSAFTPSMSELEAFVQARAAAGGQYDLYRTTRDSLFDKYGPLERISALSDDVANDYHPFLSADDREIYFGSERTDPPSIWVARRSSADDDFGPPEALSLGAGDLSDSHPSLTADGTRLFFARTIAEGDTQIFVAERPSGAGNVFRVPVPVDEVALPDTVNHSPVLYEPTDELFFVSNRPWSTSTNGIWVAQMCGALPCEEPVIDCPAPGMRSEDQRHCYSLSAGVATWDAADTACSGVPLADHHLASIHGAEEQAVAVAVASAVNAWIGASDTGDECNETMPGCVFAWTSDEPMLFDAWSGGQPDDNADVEDCVHLLGGGLWNDNVCGTSFQYICEDELWPLW